MPSTARPAAGKRKSVSVTCKAHIDALRSAEPPNRGVQNARIAAYDR
jgi:hypothetical protein